VQSGAAAPSLVREAKQEEDGVGRKPGLESIWVVQPANPCKVPRNYFAAGETDLDGAGFAAGCWLSMGTSND